MTLYLIVLIIRYFATPTTSLRINTSLVSSGQTLYQATPLETNTSLLQRFTAEFHSGEMQCLEKAEQQAEATVDAAYPPLQIVKVPFCLFSLYLYPLSAPFLNPLLPLHHPFFLFWSILCPRKIKTSGFITFCFTNGT